MQSMDQSINRSINRLIPGFTLTIFAKKTPSEMFERFLNTLLFISLEKKTPSEMFERFLNTLLFIYLEKSKLVIENF